MSAVHRFAEGQQIRVATPKLLTRKISGSQGVLRQPHSDDVAEVVEVEGADDHMPQLVTAEFVENGKVVWRAEFTADELVLAQKHDLYEDGDANIPRDICDRNGQVALGMCKRCGRAEVELSEPCTIRESA